MLLNKKIKERERHANPCCTWEKAGPKEEGGEIERSRERHREGEREWGERWKEENHGQREGRMEVCPLVHRTRR